MPPTVARRAVVLKDGVSGVQMADVRESSYLSRAREERADRRSKDIADVLVEVIFEKLLCM